MKHVFPQFLARINQQHGRAICLALLFLVTSLSLSFTSLTTTAFAATNPPAASNLATIQLSSSAESARVASVSVTSSTQTTAQAAGSLCRTLTTTEAAKDVLGVTLFWDKMKTTWCWNNVTVTSHSTVLYWGVTTTGNLTGWYSLYNPKYTFNCYVAAGSHRNCSGNHEWMQEDFVHGITPFEDCYLSINQWETYKGQSSWNTSKHTVPN